MGVDRARALRKKSTDAERALWSALRDRRLAGWKFKRQVPQGPYVVDFACLEVGLIVEVDGGQHDWRGAQDTSRTAWLEKQGLRIIRFWNNEVLGNIAGVLQSILFALEEAPSPRPSPRGGEGEGHRSSFRSGSPRSRQGAQAARGEPPLPARGEGRGEEA